MPPPARWRLTLIQSNQFLHQAGHAMSVKAWRYADSA
jgi:hypothetical protein